MRISLQAGPAPSRAWRRAAVALLVAVVLVALTLAALGVAVWDGLSQWSDAGGAGVSVTVNGADVTRSLDISAWPPAHKLMLVAVLALALLAALLVVPLAVLFGGLALVVVVLAAVALPMLIGMAVLVAAFAPIWLLLWWLAARARRQRRSQAAATTIDA